MKTEIKLTLTTLITSNIVEARNFYEKLLRQKPTIDSDSHVMYESGFSLWETSFAKSLVFGESFAPQNGECFNHELCFEVKDLEEMQTFLLDQNVPFINRLSEQPWGQLVMRIKDPDGRILELGEALEDTVARIWEETGNNREQTSRRTHIPLDVLDNYLPGK